MHVAKLPPTPRQGLDALLGRVKRMSYDACSASDRAGVSCPLTSAGSTGSRSGSDLIAAGGCQRFP
jgi:hypothetical protein